MKHNSLDKAINKIISLSGQAPANLNYLKSFAAINIRDILENTMNQDVDPVPILLETLKAYEIFFKTHLDHLPLNNKKKNEKITSDIFSKTCDMYGKLFVDFEDEDVLTEAKDLLEQRFIKNNVDFNSFKGKRCLDAGCGGGRYSIALKQMGAGTVEGVDGAQRSIDDASKRALKHEIKNCNFSVQNVLDLQFNDNYFDFVMSYGVLHHTTDLQKGLKECFRVLKPGGTFFLFLMSTNGIRYKIVKFLRAILKDVNPDETQLMMRQIGYDARKIFNFVDNLHVPIHFSISKRELENELKTVGFNEFRLLRRDVNTDRWTHPTELIYQNKPYAKLKYGDGAYKYICKKSL